MLKASKSNWKVPLVRPNWCAVVVLPVPAPLPVVAPHPAVFVAVVDDVVVVVDDVVVDAVWAVVVVVVVLVTVSSSSSPRPCAGGSDTSRSSVDRPGLIVPSRSH